MNHGKKTKGKLKKGLLVCMLTILVGMMLIYVSKLAGFSAPINALENVKNNILAALENFHEQNLL